MLRKLYRLVCFSLAFVMTIEAPAQTTPPPHAPAMQKHFKTHYKFEKMKTVGDFLKAIKKTMPPAMYAKHAANLKGYEKEQMPKITVDGHKILIDDAGKITTLEARDPAGEVFYINNEPYTRAEVEAVTPAMEKLTKGKPSASVMDFLMRSLVMDEAQAASPWLIAGIALGLFGIIALAWSALSGNSSRSKQESRANIERHKAETDPRNKNKPPPPAPSQVRVADGDDPDCMYPTDVANNVERRPTGCEISNVVEFYQLTFEEARQYLCGQPGADSEFKIALGKGPEEAAKRFQALFGSKLKAYHEQQGHHVKSPENGPIPLEHQVYNMQLCMKFTAKFDAKKCNPMQSAQAILGENGDQFPSIHRCGQKDPQGTGDYEGGLRRMLLPSESPCRIYKKSEGVTCGQRPLSPAQGSGQTKPPEPCSGEGCSGVAY